MIELSREGVEMLSFFLIWMFSQDIHKKHHCLSSFQYICVHNLPHFKMEDETPKTCIQVIKSPKTILGLIPLSGFLFPARHVWSDLPTSVKEKTTLKSFSDSVKNIFLNEFR